MFPQESNVPGIAPQDGATGRRDGLVVGVDIGGTNLRIALANQEGAVLSKWSASTAGLRDAALVVNLIRDGVAHMLQQTTLPRNSLRAIAAGAPGVTDVDRGVVIATSYLMGWRDVPLRDLLESAIGVPAAVDNDVNLAALGEYWAGAAKGTSDFVFLAIGTGIGAGIVVNHRLHHGHQWIAGEIGYMLVPGVPEEPVAFGMPGAFEAFAGGAGIEAQWHGRLSNVGNALPAHPTATDIFDLARQGNAQAQSIFSKAARTLAYGIYNVSLILNPSLVVLGGSVGMHSALCEEVQRILSDRGSRAQPKLTRSLLGPEAQITGAIWQAIETANARSISPG
jgi:glucokinase